MKTLIIALNLIQCACALHGADWSEEARRSERQQIEFHEIKYISSSGLPKDNKIQSLAEGLRGMGHWKSFSGHDAEVDKLFAKIQSRMISIPGHGKFFADEIERKRQEGPSYNLSRGTLLGTLGHIPSPETVLVLGHYLHDDRDTPPPPTRGQDWAPIPANSFIAYHSFAALGLRNVEIPETWQIWDQKKLDRLRGWFSEVKSGQRPFSFAGQTVEYRFEPDGTWKSTPLPASVLAGDPKPTAPALAQKRPPGTTGHELRRNHALKSFWPWILGVGITVLAGTAWLRSKRA